MPTPTHQPLSRERDDPTPATATSETEAMQLQKPATCTSCSAYGAGNSRSEARDWAGYAWKEYVCSGQVATGASAHLRVKENILQQKGCWGNLTCLKVIGLDQARYAYKRTMGFRHQAA